MTTIGCDEHGADRAAWIVCTHVSDDGAEPAACRRTPQELVVGEVVCVTCKQELDAREALPDETREVTDAPAALRFACHECVMQRWRSKLLS